MARLGWPLALTRLGMLAEQAVRAFWPLWSLVMLVLAALTLGLHEVLAVELVWAGLVAAFVLLMIFAWRGLRRFHWPSRDAARDRLDATLPGRPIRALLDDQAIGRGDAASEAVWAAHQARMAARLDGARPVEPDLRVSRADPMGLRFVALLVLLVGLLFGSVWRVGSLGEVTTGGAAVAGGPAWEGWVQPPGYTGLPTLYLDDIAGETLIAPEGSRITVRLYGEVGALTLGETVSQRIGEVPSAAEPVQTFDLRQSGGLSIDGPGGRSWDVEMLADRAPSVAISGEAEASARGEMTLPFSAEDDYAVTGGQASIALDLGAVDRRHGLAVEPEEQAPLVVELPMPITGDRADFEEVLIEDFSRHVWAHLPVSVTLNASDAAGQAGVSQPEVLALPARRFFDPLAAAIVEQRRDLLWSRENGTRVAQILRAVSHRPEGLFRKETSYLRLRYILRRLEGMLAHGMNDEQRQELAEAMWDLAIQLEEGDLSDALERMRRAQDRLAEAMKNGASDDEIDRLMQELREATQDYLRRLAQEQQQQQGEQGEQQLSENSTMLSQDDLQQMMDRIQELMEQGRMAEAQQALEEFQRMMENMQVTQNQGQGQQSPGQQAMDELADTMRQQQGLSDQAFRDLQEQFNPGAQSGQSAENEGFSGGKGKGQAHDGTGGQGQDGGETQQGEGQGLEGELADRQQALRQELNRQQQNLPGQGSPEGDAARDALGRAGDAMEGAEEALRNDDLAEAIDRQSEAMEAMREGMRSLGEALAQEQRQGQQGTQQGNNQGQQRDPLGRPPSNGAQVSNEGGLHQGEDVYRRARELLEEIRRRSGEGARPEVERNYLRRLLDRF